MKSLAAAAATLLLLGICGAAAAGEPALRVERFDEALALRPDGATLSFVLRKPAGSSADDASRLPLALSQLASELGLAELRLTQTHGAIERPRAPRGAELVAHFFDGGDAARWGTLHRSLSAHTCAALSTMGGLQTPVGRPRLAFPPSTTASAAADWGALAPPDALRVAGGAWYGVLPREPLCSANIEPFAELLPCGAEAGLGRMLTRRILHTRAHSLSLSLVRSRSGAMQLNATVTVALDPGDDAFAILGPAPVPCVLADSSVLQLGEGGAVPLGTVQDPVWEGAAQAWKLAASKPRVRVADEDAGGVRVYSRIHADGYVGGTLSVTVVSAHETPLVASLWQVLPWPMRPAYRTLKVSNATLLQRTLSPPNRERYTAGSSIELLLLLQRRQAATVSVEFGRAYLEMEAFPADAARGIDVPAASVTYWPDAHAAAIGSAEAFGAAVKNQTLGQPVRVYGSGMVLPSVWVDFSMPFNVVCISSTFLTLMFGSVLSASLFEQPKPGEQAPKRPLNKLVDKVIALTDIVFADAQMKALRAEAAAKEATAAAAKKSE